MNFARRSLLGLLLALGAARALAYFVYAAACLTSPLETFHLEAKMVLLAYRAEQGVPLYPEWRDYPHVANFFGPAYFLAVGKLGSAIGSDIPGLFRIGRGVTFGAGLLASAMLGAVVARRYGRFAGALGATLSLGAAPMIGFSVMVRPDVAADFLGLAGFFLAGHRKTAGRAVGGALLILAILTKQTAAIYLLAAAIAPAIEGDRKRGLRLMAGCSVAVGAIVGAITLTVEPNFARSLVGESKAPWEAVSLTRNFLRIGTFSPDLLFFPVLGLVLWATGAAGTREARPAVLAGILLATSIGLAAKRGADLNYYLGLRAAEALAAGALCRAWAIAPNRGRSAILGLACLIGCASAVPGLSFAINQARGERAKAAFLGGPYGREVLDVYRSLFEKARDPDAKILTDSGLIDLHQGTRAVFGDPWLFRMLAEIGQVEPRLVRDRIDSRYYDLIVTTSELDRPGYDAYDFGLPMPLVERARARYVRIGSRAGLFLYGRRPGASTGEASK